MHIISYPISVMCADRKLFGYACTRAAFLKHCLNLINVCLFKFGVSGKFTTGRNVSSSLPRMSHIVRLRNPLKVADMVIQFIGIFVINLRQSFWVRDEVKRNKPMNQYVPRFVSRPVAQCNSAISKRIDAPLEHFWFCTTPPTAKGPRTDLSAFSNFVKSFVALNGFPMFSIHKQDVGFVLGCVNV